MLYGLVLKWPKVFPKKYRTVCYWWSFSPSGSVGTCDEWRGTASSPSVINEDENIGSSCLHGRGNVVLVQGSGPCFETVTSSPPPPFSPRREARERKRRDLTDEEEGVKANILSHWQQLLLSHCFTWEKTHSEICTHTQQYKPLIQASTRVWILHLWVHSFSVQHTSPETNHC